MVTKNGIQKDFASKEILVQKNIRTHRCLVQKIQVKKDEVKKKLGKKNWVKKVWLKKFWVKKIFWLKEVRSKKNLVNKN